MKRKYIVLIVLMLSTTAVFLPVADHIVHSRIREISSCDRRIKREQEKLNSAKVLNEQLHQVSKVIVNSITSEKSYEPEEINSFIKKLADLADEYRIAIHTIFPKTVSSSSNRYLEQQYSMELNCDFVQLGQFLTEIERFDYIIRIKTLDVSPLVIGKKEAIPVENPVTRYKVTLELSTFKIIKEA